MDGVKDEDRKRRLRQLEETIQDPRSIANVDCLLVSWHGIIIIIVVVIDVTTTSV
jgi:hypothetical protein